MKKLNMKYLLFCLLLCSCFSVHGQLQIVKILAIDGNDNGMLGTIEIEFNEAVNDTSFQKGAVWADWYVSRDNFNTDSVAVNFFSTQVFYLGGGVTANDKYIRFTFPERSTTGALWFRYKRDGGTSDAAYNLDKSDTLLNIPATLAGDSAKPFFVSAAATSDTTIELQYTEKVIGTFTNSGKWTATGMTSDTVYTKTTDSTILILKVNSLGNTAFTAANLALTINDDNDDKITDLFGNRAANISAKPITDKQAPRFSSSSGTDDDNSGGSLSQGDSITFVFSEVLAPGSRTAISSNIQNAAAFGNSPYATTIWLTDNHTLVVTMGGGFTISLSGTYSLLNTTVYDAGNNIPASNVILQMPSSLQDITPPTADPTTPFAWNTNAIPNNEYINTNDIFELKFSEAMLNGSDQTNDTILSKFATDLGISTGNLSVSTTDAITFRVQYTGTSPCALSNGKTVLFDPGTLHDANGVASTSTISFSITDPDTIHPTFIKFYVDHVVVNMVYYNLIFSEPVYFFSDLSAANDIDIIIGTDNQNPLGGLSVPIGSANDTIQITSNEHAPTDGASIHLIIDASGIAKIRDISFNKNPVLLEIDAIITFQDNNPPDNQDDVFPNSIIVKGNSVVSIVSSGDGNNQVWFAIHDPVDFMQCDTMTSAGGTATAILAPATEGIYHLYVVDVSGNISAASIAILVVDNTAPVISSVSIPNAAMRVGDPVTATIGVVSDTTVYHHINGTIGGFSLYNLTKESNIQYNATFTIVNGGTDVSAGSSIPVNFTITDSAGNVSSAYSTAISQNADPIYANRPTAILSGGSAICSGDSTTLTAILTGIAPWSITVTGGPSPFTINNILTSPRYFKVAPVGSPSFTYTISNVTDQSTLNQAGTGSSVITVNSLPTVNITNPASSKTYASDAAADTLTGTPVSGIFSGDGVVPSNNTFHPDQAGLGDHDIIYAYTNPATTCTNRDTVTVTVSDADAQIHIDAWNLLNCKEDDPFVITGSNTFGHDGTFEIQVGGTYYSTGYGLENTGANQATVNPQLLSDGTFSIRYHYDTLPSTFDVSASIEIEDVSTPVISGIKNRCIDGDTIILNAGNLIPSGGHGYFSYNGPSGGLVINPADPGNRAILYPINMGVGTYTVSYYYVSPNGCYSDTLGNPVTIHPLPNVSFISKELYNIEEAASSLTGVPAGGTFSGGTYISGNDFDPGNAGIGNHSITYTYTDPTTGCSNDSSRTVAVEKASGAINGINITGLYCFSAEMDTFTAVPTNGDGSPGTYVIVDGITDLGSNKAEFNAGVAGGNPSGGTKQHIISFNYTGWDGVTPFVLRDTIFVDYIPEVDFSGLDNAYCVNDQTGHDLIGNSPTAGAGTFLYFPGLSINGNRAKLYPYLVDSFPSQITYQFVSAMGCSRDTSKAFLLNPLPYVTFSIRPTFNWEEPPIILTGEPDGGYFTGSGGIIYSTDTTFDPGFMGGPILNVRITYTYEDANGCRNDTAIEVDIVEQNATINALRSTNKQYCVYDDIDTIVGVPNVNEPGGTFDEIPGLTNISEDTALFDPKVAGGGVHKITYHYFDAYGAPFQVTATLTVDIVRSPVFQNIDNGDEYCQNDDELEIITNGDETVTTSYTLNGENILGGILSPSDGEIGNNDLGCTFTSISTGCSNTNTINVRINAVPEINFTVSDNCVNEDDPDSVTFINNTTMASSDSIVMWAWNFDDVNSGAANTDSIISPKHLYKESGNRFVNLNALTEEGCFASQSIKFEFGDKPKADFTWDNECFTTNNVVNFIDNTSSISTIDSTLWTFLDDNSSSTDQNPQHHYTTQDNHEVELSVVTQKGCSDNIRKTVRLRPTVNLGDNIYYENFEGGENGWYPENEEQTQLYSWNFGLPSGNKITPPDSGNYVWYTNIDDITLVEQSWITSPCFDFSGLDRPMIKLNLARDMETNRNGVVIQSTTDNGITWINVGRPEEGINWYNSFEINKGPGGQSSGWTGSSPAWKEARQHLEGLANKQNVRLRIAFSNDGNGLRLVDGFALDNIYIGERTKNVLLEHFTNISDASSISATENINSLLSSSNDIIPIFYHTSFPGTDPINQFYPAGPSARSLYYGFTKVPYCIINGGYESSLVFDQSVTTFEKTDIIVWSLYDPLFNLEITSNKAGETYSINTNITALAPFQKKEIALRVAIVEKTVELSETEIYKNVLRAMLPNPGGTIYNQAWNEDQQQSNTYNWTVPSGADITQLAAIVFLQDEITGEVYQVATDDTTYLQTSIFEQYAKGASLQYLLYPNPAKEMAYILFSNPLEQDYTLEVINGTGSLVSKEMVYRNTKQHELHLNNYRSGIYFLRISNAKGSVSTRKLIVLPD